MAVHQVPGVAHGDHGGVPKGLVPGECDHRGSVGSWVAAHWWIVLLLAATAVFHAVFVWRTSLVIDHHRTFVLFECCE